MHFDNTQISKGKKWQKYCFGNSGSQPVKHRDVTSHFDHSSNPNIDFNLLNPASFFYLNLRLGDMMSWSLILSQFMFISFYRLLTEVTKTICTKMPPIATKCDKKTIYATFGKGV